MGAIIVDSSGFEPPDYSTTFPPAGPGAGSGQLEGQVPNTFNGTWLRTKGMGSSSAVVQGAVVDDGVQAVRVDRAANSDQRWAVPVSGYPSIGQNYICIHWSMNVAETMGGPNFGPYFAVEAYDDDANQGGDPLLFGSFGVDATTGELLYQAAGTGFLTTIPDPMSVTGTKLVPFDTWHDYTIQLDFLTHTYQFAFDGQILGSAAFVDDGLTPGGLNEFTDADIAAVAGAGNPGSLALTGTAYYDNFVVEESVLPCIPEPTALILAALAVAGEQVRRRTTRR
jgi:hypothetical protein